MSNSILTLFSSNSTIQYTKDIFSVLSLPRNYIFQFRYQAQHVPTSVASIFQNKTKGAQTKALIAFRSGSTDSDDDIFIIPIRWVEITTVKLFSDVYTVYFKLNGYPTFSILFEKMCSNFTSINEAAKQYFKNHETLFAVQPEHLDFVNLDDDPARDTENWRSIVECLVSIPTYEDYHFLKCSPFYSEKICNGQSVHINCQRMADRSVLTEGICTNIDLDYYSKTYDKTRTRHLEVFVDENVLSKAKGLRTVLQSRYGSITLGFQPQATANNTISEVSICTSNCSQHEIQTEVLFPIIIKKNHIYKIRKAIIMAMGAALVALPGILGDTVNIAWNISFAIAGVAVLGINNYWES